MFKKAVGLILVLGLTLSMAINVSAYKNLELLLVEEFGYEFVTNHNQSLDLAEELLSSFPRNRNGEIIHPDSFGGIYINNYGNLVVLTVLDENENDFTYFARPVSHVDMQTVDFSYNYLLSIHDYISQLFLNDPTEFNIGASFFTTSQNRIRVQLIHYTDWHIEQFRNYIINSPAIIFEPYVDAGFELRIGTNYFDGELEFDLEQSYCANLENIDPFSERSTIWFAPGERIWVESAVGSGRFIGPASAGYRANTTFANNRGFVTVAHTVMPGGVSAGARVINQSGALLGRIAPNPRLQSIDAARVQLEPNVMFSDSTAEGVTIVNQVATILEGTMVSITGTPSNILSARTVTGRTIDPRVNRTVQGVSIINGSEIAAVTAAGQSGGIAFTQGNRHVQGILFSGNNTVSIISHAHEINFLTGWRPN